METKKILIMDEKGNFISNSKAILWGNNAAWLCTECNEILGNRTGDTEYQVSCEKCNTVYEIDRSKNKNGNFHLGPAKGIRKIR